MAKQAPERRVVIEGSRCAIEFGIDARMNSEAREFLDSLTNDPRLQGKGLTARRRFIAMFETLCNGQPLKKSSFSKEVGEIYGFKYSINNALLRIACFKFSGAWVLTHGFFKKGAQKKLGVWPPEELSKADRIRHEHLAHFS